VWHAYGGEQLAGVPGAILCTLHVIASTAQGLNTKLRVTLHEHDTLGRPRYSGVCCAPPIQQLRNQLTAGLTKA
jgi:hypothetical protein